MSKARNTDQLVKGAGYETDIKWTDSKLVWPVTTAAASFDVISGSISPSTAHILLSAQIKLNRKLTVAWSVDSVDRGFFRYPLTVGDVDGKLLEIYDSRNPGKGIFIDQVRLKTEGTDVPGSDKTGTAGLGESIKDLVKPVLTPVLVGLGVLVLLVVFLATRPGATPLSVPRAV